jgi:putative two-component system response regulator
MIDWHNCWKAAEATMHREDVMEGTGRMTVMAVDDTPANLGVLEAILSAQGYRIVSFPKGELALKAAAKVRPDVILLDIMMPEMDGFEVCRRLKADQQLSHIPVIFLSALNDTKDVLQAFSAGGVDYIVKPFQAEEVLARVRTHVTLHQMQHQLKLQNQHLEQLVQEKVKEITDSQFATLFAITNLSEFRDNITGRHIDRTRTFCRELAEELRRDSPYRDEIDEDYIRNLYQAAPLHDIGKIGIPDRILLKPGRLSAEEFAIMKTHAEIGARTLEMVLERYPRHSFIKMGVEVARSHHEKWDGTGYPQGLKGLAIPLSGRIMALADVYDALRSKRPYKDIYSQDEAVSVITTDSGFHFDPEIVRAFRKLSDRFHEISIELQDSDEGLLPHRAVCI